MYCALNWSLFMFEMKGRRFSILISHKSTESGTVCNGFYNYYFQLQEHFKAENIFILQVRPVSQCCYLKDLIWNDGRFSFYMWSGEKWKYFYLSSKIFDESRPGSLGDMILKPNFLLQATTWSISISLKIFHQSKSRKFSVE